MTAHENHDGRRVVVCSHVAVDGLPVREVFHEHDGEWQFLCGGDDHVDASTARVACWQCMMEQDATLPRLIEDMATGTWASRPKAGRPWQISAYDANTN